MVLAPQLCRRSQELLALPPSPLRLLYQGFGQCALRLWFGSERITRAGGATYDSFLCGSQVNRVVEQARVVGSDGSVLGAVKEHDQHRRLHHNGVHTGVGCDE